MSHSNRPRAGQQATTRHAALGWTAVAWRRDPGLAGLYLFAFSMWSLRPLAVVGCLLMLLALWRERAEARVRLGRTALGLSTFAVLLYLCLHTAGSALLDSEHARLHLKDGARALYLGGFLLVAWQLRHPHNYQQRLLITVLLCALGFALARLAHLIYTVWDPAAAIPHLLPGEVWWQARPGLGLEIIALGYGASALLLGLVVFAPRLLRLPLSGRARWLALLLWLGTATLCMQCLLLAQSRAAWLGLALLLPLALIATVRNALRVLPDRSHVAGPGTSGTTLAVLLATLLCVLLAVLAANRHTIGERVKDERATLALLLQGEFGQVSGQNALGEERSIGIRYLMLRDAYMHWLQAPFVGHGSAASKLLLAQSDDPALHRFNDYHNVLLEWLLRFGMLGLLLAILPFKYTLAAGWHALRTRQVAADIALFLGVSLALLLFSTLSNFRLLNYDFRYWVFLLGGALAGLALSRVPVPAQTPTDRPAP